METNSPKKGRLIAIGFIVILVLPICYALVKELLLKRTSAPKVETTIPKADSAR